MKRFFLFEFNDQVWLPQSIRHGVTNYISFVLTKFNVYDSFFNRLGRVVIGTKTTSIIDLCSGGSGPWAKMHSVLKIPVLLTDIFPNVAAYKQIAGKSEYFSYCEKPVNATAVPPNLKGFRTLFSSFHHFTPQQAKNILQDAVNKQQNIAIFESSRRNLFNLLFVLLNLFTVMILTPRMKQLSWSQLFWTYLIPVIPLIMTWDAFVSNLRAYTPSELLEMMRGLTASDTFNWQVGEELSGSYPYPTTYLIGTVKKTMEGGNTLASDVTTPLSFT